MDTTPATYSIHRYPAELIESLQLHGAPRITLRPVLPQDEPLIARFVAGLSAETRYERFHHAVNGLTSSRLAQMTQLDYTQHLAMVATIVGDDGDETVIADARFVADDDGDCAEFALVVDDRWQGHGLGRRLMGALAAAARRRGLRWLRGEVLVSNAPMLSLMRRCGFHCAARDDDHDLRVRVEQCLQQAPRAAKAGWLARLLPRVLH